VKTDLTNQNFLCHQLLRQIQNRLKRPFLTDLKCIFCTSDGNKNKGQKKRFNKKDIQCYNFQKWGNFAAECKSKKVPREKSDEAQFVHENYGYDLRKDED
jgi:hypothetical protein